MDGWLARFPDRLLGDDGEPLPHDGGLPAPGKRTLTQGLSARAEARDDSDGVGYLTRSIQMEAARPGTVAADDPFAIHTTAREGVRDGGASLPHLAAIQTSFGHHDVGGVRAHVGGAAAEASAAIGAHAYATGDDVAFAGAPDLRQAAHEAAHVVQQRGGVRLDNGVGRSGDPYEQHADAVADLVVRGDSAEALLDTMAHRGAGGGAAVQRLTHEERLAARTEASTDLSLEQLAHRMAYLDSVDALSADDRRALTAQGFDVAGIRAHAGASSGAGDLQFWTFPAARDATVRVTPVIAFRGTESLADLSEDATAAGVGMAQFTMNQAAIQAAIHQIGDGRGVVATGHSLGGALAQIAACFFPELVVRVVTFQAPGISADVLERLRRREAEGVEGPTATHHRVDGCVVDDAGDGFVAGRVVVWGDGTNAIHAHTTFPLLAGARAPEPWMTTPDPNPVVAASGPSVDPAIGHVSAVGSTDGASDGGPARMTGTGGTAEAVRSHTTVDGVVAGGLAGGPLGAIVGGVAADRVGADAARRDAYVRVWMTDILPHAEAVDLTLLDDVIGRRCGEEDIADQVPQMLGNYRALFPELVACDAVLRSMVGGGGPDGRVAFIEAVAAQVSLDDRLQDRVKRYWTLLEHSDATRDLHSMAGSRSDETEASLRASERLDRARALDRLAHPHADEPPVAHAAPEPRGAAAATMSRGSRHRHPVSPDGGSSEAVDVVHSAAAHGVGGAGAALPHFDAIQASFGHHDVGGVRAHVGGAAAEAADAIGARAYATGDDVAFAASPDLRQAAHEAAHVVQQRGGVRLDGGVGRAGDPYEQHADAVAELVIRGDSAEALLDTMAHRGAGGGAAVQREDFDGDGRDDGTLSPALRRAVGAVTTVAALSEAQNAAMALLGTAPDRTVGVAIGGAEHPILGREVHALLVYLDARMIALGELEHDLARGGGETGVGDSGLGSRTGPSTAGPERHASADPGTGFRFDLPMPGPYGGELHVAFSLSGLVDAVAEGSSGSSGSSDSSDGGGGGVGISGGMPFSHEGADIGVGVTGALQELFAPGCDTLRDRFGVTHEPDGSTHVMFGLDFWPFPPIDEHAEVRFQVDIVEMEWGQRGLRVHGPQAGVHAQGTMGYLHDHLPEGMRSRLTMSPAMRPVTIGVDFMWEPNWAAVAAHFGMVVAEDAALAGVAGATATELTIGGAEAAAIAGEVAVDAALLVIAAPEILLIGGVVLVVAAGYALSSGRHSDAYPEPLSTDHQPGVDDPLTHLGHDFGRAINHFGAGYASALLGLSAPDGDAAHHGYVAGRRRRDELVAAGHSASDIAFAARAAADLQERLRQANRASLEQEARELAAQHASARASELHRSESSVRTWAERHLVSIAHSGSEGLIASTIDHARSVMRMAEREVDPAAVQAHASHGVGGGGETLPHLEAIQASFGHHEVTEVRAHVGGVAAEASAAMGARAYASGNDVAFAASPDLRLAAHEAAHVVQQRGDVRLDGGVGRSGDHYEQHADAVAELVVRGDSAEAALDTMAHRGAAGGSAVQRDLDDPVYIDIVVIPREMPTRAGRQLQAALMRGIPADRRRDQGLVLLNTLPALANILDPSITAAGEGDLIVSRSSAWHPASFEGDGIPAPYMWALWDFYKARWESEDRPTRRAHLEAAHDHWYDLMTVRLFNEFVRTEREEVRALVHSLIDGPARRLRSDATFDVLSHDGNALSAEERAARARRATEAAAARASHRGSTTRSETIDVAPEAVRVTDGEPRTVRYISPAALAFVPHIPSETPNPRRAAFDPLAAVLNDLIAAEGDAAAIAAVEARLATSVAETRERMQIYVRQHRRGAERDTALATIGTLELTTDVEVRSHDVDVGMFRVHLEPVAPGALIERPGGFRASVTDIATGRGATGGASEEVMTAVLSGFTGDEQVLARQYLEVIRRAEGSLTSLNTWDRLRITLGAGVGAAGRLQDRFAMFESADSEAYERIFGRHGIGVEGRGIHGDRGAGRSTFETTGDDGEALSGTEATEEMANDPATLGVMVTAGFDPAWQTFLLQGGAGSLRRALTVSFTVTPAGTVILAEGGGGTRVYDWLHGHVSANVAAAAMFAFADDFHGSGSLTSGTTTGFGPQYLAAATTHHFEPAHPEAAPDPARAAVGAWIVTDCSHARRRRFIAEALGVGSYGAITGG